MSKPFANPFLEADMSKLFPMNMSKMTGDFRMPQWDMESLMTAQRRNVEACTALTQSIYESWQSLYSRQADMCRQIMEQTTQSIGAVAASATPEEKIVKQAEVGKLAVEKCLTNMRDITETVAKCNSQAVEAVSNRMNESLDELRGIIKTNRAA